MELSIFPANFKGKFLYYLPLLERYTHFGGGLKAKCVERRGVGMTVYYDDEIVLGQFLAGKFGALLFRRETYCIIEADSFQEAFGIFLDEWDGARIGGQSAKFKALRIDSEKEAIEFPVATCCLINKVNVVVRDDGVYEVRYICGDLTPYYQYSLWPICTIEEPCDVGEECPYQFFWTRLGQKRPQIKPKIWNGIRIINANQV